jgi:hypothetical protein
MIIEPPPIRLDITKDLIGDFDSSYWSVYEAYNGTSIGITK